MTCEQVRFWRCCCSTSCLAAKIEIPFRWTPGQIEVPVSFAGREPVWCVVDSGAEFSMLDKATAHALQLSDKRILTATIGPLKLDRLPITLWQLDNFRRQKRDIRGVIGCELFERYVVTLDFRKQVLIVEEPTTFRPNPRAVAFPITFAGRLPVLRTRLRFVRALVDARLMIDTGASHGVILRHPFATEHHLFDNADPTTTADTVALGPTPFATIPARELVIGQWSFSNPSVEAYATPRGAGGYTVTDGLLGTGVLRNFRVTFDYARKKLYLEKV